MDIGGRIRAARLSKSLILEDLSDKTGLSKSFLSNVENNRTSPSINSMEKIAHALEIPLSVLFMQKSFSPQIVKAGQRDQTRFGQDERVVEWISNMPFSNIEMLLLEIPVRKDPAQRAPLHTHRGEECHLVLEGKLRGTYGTQSFTVEAGDSFHWDGSVPHNVDNIGDTPARLIIALTPPSYFASDKAHADEQAQQWNGQPISAQTSPLQGNLQSSGATGT